VIFKRILMASATVLTFAASAPANAALLLFNFNGPSGTAQFQLDAKPAPDFNSSFIGSDQFGFNNVSGTFGGVPGTASTISFGNGIFAAFNIVSPNLGFTQFSSPVLFTGTGAAPVFSTGTFTLINPFFGNGTLTISPVAAAVRAPRQELRVSANVAAPGCIAQQRCLVGVPSGFECPG
jgi:hypothetical protein